MCNADDKKFYNKDSFRLFFSTMEKVLITCAVIAVFYGAYFMAEQTFSNQAYDNEHHYAIQITVSETDSSEEVAAQLEEKKLIYGKYRFMVRKYFSKYKDKSFIPGDYVFKQSQGMDDIMGILCGEQEIEETQ